MTPPTPDAPEEAELPQDEAPACVMVFNASDPSGAGGLSADAVTVASVGGHALTVATGAYARDSARIFDHFPLDEEAVAEQARAVLEDIEVDVIKVGFVGTPENISTIAEIAADYEDIPLVAYMPDLSWWAEDDIEAYLDAFRELLLPQTTLLVGNHSTLWRWLLPDWPHQRSPTPRDIAKAASETGVPYTLVTGVPLPEQFVENVLVSPQAVLGSGKFELFDAVFSGAGDTLSAALAALLANGKDLGESTSEALHYLDRCLDAGFRPGMGNVLPDRMFWAQGDPDDDEDDDDGEDPDAIPADPERQALEGFVMPPRDTQH